MDVLPCQSHENRTCATVVVTGLLHLRGNVLAHGIVVSWLAGHFFLLEKNNRRKNPKKQEVRIATVKKENADKMGEVEKEKRLIKNIPRPAHALLVPPTPSKKTWTESQRTEVKQTGTFNWLVTSCCRLIKIVRLATSFPAETIYI